MRRELYAGVMSGTSLDGVDAVLADFSPGVATCSLLAATHIDFPTKLRQELLALQGADKDEIVRAARAANVLADLYVHALRSVCAAANVAAHDVVAAGIHGRRCGTDRTKAGRCRSTIRHAWRSTRT
jgi:anhydro-N-acetylmuramic acid kinase